MRIESHFANATPPPDRDAILRTIEALEGQRGTLGDSAVDLAITPLRARLAEGEASGNSRASKVGAERKVVTVLFVDVAGFTGMSERIGSEATHDVVNSLFESLVPLVERYGGVVDKFIGDEIMAVFGAPRSVERHAEHALRAALAMFAALDEYNRSRGLALALHAGVNTGEVIAGRVGSSGRHDYSVTGDTVNVAARLQGAARSGEIVVGPSTYRHTFQWFEFEPMEPLSLKGKASPLVAYRLLGAARKTRLRPEGFQLPFSGREAALDGLLVYWQRDAVAIRGAVFVRARPGLGKTRLVSELHERIGDQARWLDASGQDYRSDLSYGVVSELLDGIVGLGDATSHHDAVRAYTDFVNGFEGERARRMLPFLLWLRGLPLADADDVALSALGADALRERITAAVGDLLAATTAGRPTIVCVEDIHWADPSSVALVRSLAEAPALAHVLFVLTTRPDLSAASAWIDVVAQIDGGRRIVDLAPLSGQDSRSLLGQAFADGSSSTLIDEIGAKADGNPLYLASFLRSLMESGLATLSDGRVAVDAPLAALAIPDTVQAVLGSQIDRLPALGKEVLQWAAILGNTFAPSAVAEMGAAEGVVHGVEAMLSLLRERQLLVTDSDDRLRFVHALLRDVGYEQMLERERRRLHGVAARIVEKQVAGVAQPAEADVALLAWHHERAGESAPASLRYEQAATLAANSHAHPEELLYLESAIRLADPAARGRLAELHERTGDTLQLVGRYAEAAERYESILEGADATAGIGKARLYRKIARAWIPRMDGDKANAAVAEARRCLAASADSPTNAWWREHFAIELLAMWALYMQACTDEGAQIAASLAPEIDTVATIRERGLFHRSLALLRLRQQRYRPDAGTIELARRASSEVRDSGDVADLCLTTFSHAFAQLWSGAIEEADRELQGVLKDTVRLGDAERNLLCLVYLSVAARQLGDADSAEAFANAAIVRARTNGSPHYEAVACGTLAWVAWRRGDAALADRFVDLAQHSMIPNFPFAWMYAAVAVAIAVERGDIDNAKGMVADMLEPTHQRLDDNVQAVFEQALAEPSLTTLQSVVETCRRVRYL